MAKTQVSVSSAWPKRVRALRNGFFGHGEAGTRIRAGRTFTVNDPKDFSPGWMVEVPWNTPDDLAEQLRVAQEAPTRRNANSSGTFVSQMRAKPTLPARGDAEDTTPTGAADVL